MSEETAENYQEVSVGKHAKVRNPGITLQEGHSPPEGFPTTTVGRVSILFWELNYGTANFIEITELVSNFAHDIRASTGKNRLQHCVIVNDSKPEILVDALSNPVECECSIFGFLCTCEQSGEYLCPTQSLSIVIHPVEDVLEHTCVTFDNFISRYLELAQSLSDLVSLIDIVDHFWICRKPP